MSDENYLPIRTSTLRGDQPIEFDVFIKMSDKHILYLRRGDNFEGQRLLRLKEKKLKHLYILHEQEKLYRLYLSTNIEQAYDKKSKKSIKNRSEIIHGNLQSHSEDLIEDPANNQSYYFAKIACGRFAEFLTSELEAVGHMLEIKNTDQNLSHHCVNVAALSCVISRDLKLFDKSKNQNLALGALIHDIDHFYSGIPSGDLSKLTEDQTQKYLQHPLNGFTRLNDKKHFDADVLDIVLQHEEYVDGKGYPRQLTESKLNPLSVLVGAANSFDRLMSYQGLPAKEAAKQILIKKMGCYPLEYLKAIESAVASLKF